jgi:hypothetical protein
MCHIDNQPNIDKLKSKLGFGWHIFPLELKTKKVNLASINPSLNKNELFCIHCGSHELTLVGFDEYQTVSGDSAEWVYQCKMCKKNMTIVKEP